MRIQPSVQTYVGNVIAMLAFIAIMNCAIVCAESDATVQPTRGQYMGQSWHIDADHLLWWQGKPYVRYGFTGNGDVDRFMEKGFNQFNAYPSEALCVFSKDPAKNRQAIHEVDAFTDLLQEKGATYYAGLNLLWPWRGSGKIAEEDMVGCVFRKVWDITEISKKEDAIELEFISDISLEVNRQNVQVYLFDFAAEQYEDISEKLKDVQTAEKTIEESAGERYRATTHRLKFEPMRLPNSGGLRVTVLIRMALPTVPGMYPGSFPALWKPGIQQYYRNGLQQFRAAYRKPGLRGMKFGAGITDCNPAFKKAIAACTKAGGGRVVVSKGIWLTNGPTHLDNNVNFHVTKDARILFGTNFDDYLPHVRVRWEGTECYSYL